MKVFLMVNLLIIFIASCGSHMARQEEQAVRDSFDQPVGSEVKNPYIDPYGRQPR